MDLEDAEVARDRPVEPGLRRELRQSVGEQRRHLLRPARVVGPGMDDEVLAAGQVDAGARQGRRTIRIDDRVPVGDIGDPGRRVDGRRCRRSTPSGPSPIVSASKLCRNDDPDRSAVAERPRDEADEGRPDPDLALRARRAAGQVERHADRSGLAVEQRPEEADVELDVVGARLLADGDGAPARAGPDRACLRLDAEPEAVVEVARPDAARDEVGLVVPRRTSTTTWTTFRRRQERVGRVDRRAVRPSEAACDVGAVAGTEAPASASSGATMSSAAASPACVRSRRGHAALVGPRAREWPCRSSTGVRRSAVGQQGSASNAAVAVPADREPAAEEDRRRATRPPRAIRFRPTVVGRVPRRRAKDASRIVVCRSPPAKAAAAGRGRVRIGVPEADDRARGPSRGTCRARPPGRRRSRRARPRPRPTRRRTRAVPRSRSASCSAASARPRPPRPSTASRSSRARVARVQQLARLRRSARPGGRRGRPAASATVPARSTDRRVAGRGPSPDRRGGRPRPAGRPRPTTGRRSPGRSDPRAGRAGRASPARRRRARRRRRRRSADRRPGRRRSPARPRGARRCPLAWPPSRRG